MPYGPESVRGHKVASTWGFEKNPLFLSAALKVIMLKIDLKSS